MKLRLHIERLVVDSAWHAAPGQLEAAVESALTRTLARRRYLAPVPTARRCVPELQGWAEVATAERAAETLAIAVHDSVFGATGASMGEGSEP